LVGPGESRLEEEIISSADKISSLTFLFGATILSPKVTSFYFMPSLFLLDLK
jgi:hypothetical protein